MRVHTLWMLSAALVLVTGMLGCGSRPEPAANGSRSSADESSPEHQPAVTKEAAIQKREEAGTSFAGKVTKDGGEHAAGIKKLLDDLHLAVSRRGPTWIDDVFDARRLVRLLKQQGLLPVTWAGDNENQLLRKLGPQLRQALSHPVVGITRRRCEIRQVRFLQDETEAVVHSRHWDADDVSAKVRLWLVRRDGKWRVYDFEELEVSMRFSTALGIGSMMVDQRNPSIRALPWLLQGCQEVVGGDSEQGVEILERLKGEDFPPVVESLRLAMIAEGWRDQKEYAKALKAADRAVAINNDLPFMHLTYARCHNGLGQHEKALEAADRYAKLLGKDAYYFAEMGDACAGMGRTADAVAAYKSGLNDDPQSAVNVLGLMRLLPDAEHAALVQYYKQLNDLDEWFDAMAEEFIQEKDAKTLRRLIEIHKSVVPDDERIPKYEHNTSDFEVGRAFLFRHPEIFRRLPLPVLIFWRVVEEAKPAAPDEREAKSKEPILLVDPTLPATGSNDRTVRIRRDEGAQEGETDYIVTADDGTVTIRQEVGEDHVVMPPWQSFQAPIDGSIATIELRPNVYGGKAGKLSFYEGEGIKGKQLHTQDYERPSVGGAPWQTFDLTSPLKVEKNKTYTWELTGAGGLMFSKSNRYPHGRAASRSRDMCFRIHITPSDRTPYPPVRHD